MPTDPKYLGPSPNPNETEDEFISRCMSSPEMKKKHPDRDNRLAVCYSFWRNKGEDDIDMSDVMADEDAS